MPMGDPSFDSLSPQEQADVRVRQLGWNIEDLRREIENLRARIRFLEACLGRDMVDVFHENERLKREHEEMRQRLADWQTGRR